MSTALKKPTASSPRPRAALRPYQERAAAFVRDNPRCALWIEMGLGKTAATLTAIVDLRDRFEAQRVLVVAPKLVALHSWPDEIAAWAHTAGLDVLQLTGLSAKARADAVRRPADVTIINRELIPWLVLQWRTNWPYDMVVLDEASSFKSPSSQRFKALRKVLPAIYRIVELTGTPTSNGLLDLWAQMFLLDRGQRLGRSMTAYKDRWFVSDWYGYNWTPKKGAAAEIRDAVADLCLTMRAQDYLDLPPRIDLTHGVELPRAARAVYQDMERTFLAEFGDDGDVEAITAAALSNKLLQIANGALYGADQKVHLLHDAKLEALKEIAEGGEPLLVAYNYRFDLTRLRQAFPKAVDLKDGPDVLDRWNRGEIDMLLAHPASAGHGLNLQHGGATVVWYGLNWSLELYQQFNARLHRQGQTRPVRVRHIVAENTVDETVLAALATKNATQRTLLNALRDDAKRRL